MLGTQLIVCLQHLLKETSDIVKDEDEPIW